MYRNTEVAGEDGAGDTDAAGWPLFPGDCDRAISDAVNTLLAMFRVSDAIIRITRTISDHRRRSREQGLMKSWWPDLNCRLEREHIAPLREDLFHLELNERYAAFVAQTALKEATAFLEQPSPVCGLPRYQRDEGLIACYMQPVFESLRDIISADEWPQALRDQNDAAVLIDRLTGVSLLEWFKRGGGAELEQLLQYLVLGEYFTIAYHDGLYRNVFELAEDRFSLLQEEGHIRWNQSGIEAILFAIATVRRRIDVQNAKRRNREAPKVVFFCELCDELTQRIGNEPDASRAGTGSKRYCERHASGGRSLYCKDLQNKQNFDLLRSAVLGEAKRDPAYRRRLVGINDANWLEIDEHIATCIFCGGHPLEPPCFDTLQSLLLPSLLAFHANARKVAYRLAGHHNSVASAYLIDEAVQQGECARDVGPTWRLNTPKAIGQHSSIALARLLHQRVKGSEIARRLGITPSAVSQRRKTSLSGCFDFAPSRAMDLVWWPFDDITGPDIARFPTSIIGWNWRHSPAEYSHLSSKR